MNRATTGEVESQFPNALMVSAMMTIPIAKSASPPHELRDSWSSASVTIASTYLVERVLLVTVLVQLFAYLFRLDNLMPPTLVSEGWLRFLIYDSGGVLALSAFAAVIAKLTGATTNHVRS